MNAKLTCWGHHLATPRRRNAASLGTENAQAQALMVDWDHMRPLPLAAVLVLETDEQRRSTRTATDPELRQVQVRVKTTGTGSPGRRIEIAGTRPNSDYRDATSADARTSAISLCVPPWAVNVEAAEQRSGVAAPRMRNRR